MKTKLYLGVGVVVATAAMLVVLNQGAPDATAQQVEQPVVEQPQTTERQATEARQYDQQATTDRAHKSKRACKASELIGMNVRGTSGDDNIGSINDLMIGHDGRVNYAAVSFGGFLGLGDKLFAIPLDAIEFVKSDDESYARIDVSEETLKNTEGFDQDNWPEHANRNFAARPEHRQADRPATEVDVDVTR